MAFSGIRMDYRCPLCRKEIVRRRLSQTVMLGLEIECPHCKRVIRHNLHRAETVIIMLNFAAIIVLGVLAYRLHSQKLLIATLGVAMAGAAIWPLLEHTYLRRWPRYAAMPARAETNEP